MEPEERFKCILHVGGHWARFEAFKIRQLFEGKMTIIATIGQIFAFLNTTPGQAIATAIVKLDETFIKIIADLVKKIHGSMDDPTTK